LLNNVTFNNATMICPSWPRDTQPVKLPLAASISIQGLNGEIISADSRQVYRGYGYRNR